MTLRTILACLTSTQSAPHVLAAAALLARRDTAHLIGLFVTESLVMYPGIAVHIPESSYKGFIASQQAYAKEMQDLFEKQTQAETFPTEWRKVSSESGFVADTIIGCARSVDLMVIAQEDDDEERPQNSSLQERLIRESGRPVLVIPRNYDGNTLGERVVLGWSDTREATRAVHDMIDTASADAKVMVLRIGTPPGNTLADDVANEMAVALARHGLQTKVVHRDKDGNKVADILAHEAFEYGADMLTTGAFGHSRAYDFVIGAATRALLRDAKLPVLFSK